ncbi:eukaryotic rRNA processing protein EBP2-domain-containing protein [Cantharellus anzutake]|uniref:eukaryotic rRNA processing protein EBP2-domain-containing protein n=1 Tax=Cantharellus anzutake TaxID=1750568 RepID=UPI001907D264|nr:eukaryotic rRNA processing protein EBP2-domain-containing protein [Cantharellus anzutake]KAF8326985.1 eukaryotic rRNA processing protein EBP2-domain-containing protein [Cantharellus anzutake]
MAKSKLAATQPEPEREKKEKKKRGEKKPKSTPPPAPAAVPSDREEEGEEVQEPQETNEDHSSDAVETVDGEENEEQAPYWSTDEEESESGNERAVVENISKVKTGTVQRGKVVITIFQEALQRIRETIKLDPSLPWTDHLTLTYPEPLGITNPDDDLPRELAFYKQALYCANEAKSLAKKYSLPFSRPSDYFAEMVKSDSHMERIRQGLLNESAGIQKSEEARKQRELKKFGKQVQVEKLKERQKTKKDMEDRLKSLKRKRGKQGLGGGGDDGDDEFDVAVEDAVEDNPKGNKRAKTGSGRKKPRMSREKRDAKYGFGGSKKWSKSNTRESTNDFDSGARRRIGTKKAGKPAKRYAVTIQSPAENSRLTYPLRLGKSRRHATRSRK